MLKTSSPDCAQNRNREPRHDLIRLTITQPKKQTLTTTDYNRPHRPHDEQNKNLLYFLTHSGANTPFGEGDYLLTHSGANNLLILLT